MEEFRHKSIQNSILIKFKKKHAKLIHKVTRQVGIFPGGVCEKGRDGAWEGILGC